MKTAPGTWPCDHSSASRTSTRTAPPAESFRASSTETSRISDLTWRISSLKVLTKPPSEARGGAPFEQGKASALDPVRRDSRSIPRPGLPEPRATIRPAPMLKILEGSLDRFEVPDLLSFLGTGGRTGVLVFERPDRESKVFLREGRPVFATSTGEELRFGSMLVRLGKVRADVLERALSRQPGGRIGQVLISEKILTEQELAAFLKVQVSEVIFDAFGWNEGAFSFFDDVPPPATVVTLEMDLLNLIIEGMRRLDDPERAEATFPDRDRAVEALVNPERLKRSAVLTDEEWRLFFLLDGRRSVSEICRLMGTSDDRPTLQILSRLRAARFVGLVASRGAPPPGAAPKSQPAGTQKLPDLRQPER